MKPPQGTPSVARRFKAAACVGLLLLGMLGLGASSAGAATSHYTLMTQQLAQGVQLRCADVDYAAAQGLIDPVEVRWLSAAGVKCPNEQYEVMLALGTKGQLACADVQWNAANGLVNWNQAAGLLWRVPGCELTKYAFLVALAAQGGIGCVDVDWHQNVGLISAEQAGWLKASLGNQGRYCYTTGMGARTSPVPKGWLVPFGDWLIQVQSWEPNVSAQVAAYNRFNEAPPPGYVYARMTVSTTYTKGTGTGSPAGINVNLIDQWSNAYDDTFVSGGSGGDENSLWLKAATVPGGTVSGAIYYKMPVGSAAGPVLGYHPYITYSDVPVEWRSSK
ncbi:MAG: hypothetical protein QOJ19_2191 [Acidimicrobiia bacterium]|nr:hypothetical protein [Acidimicrobiia bacterium]